VSGQNEIDSSEVKPGEGFAQRERHVPLFALPATVFLNRFGKLDQHCLVRVHVVQGVLLVGVEDAQASLELPGRRRVAGFLRRHTED
jgi:hypothetical protein